MVGHRLDRLAQCVQEEVHWPTEAVVLEQEPAQYPLLAEDAIMPQHPVAEASPHAQTVEAEEGLVLSPVVRNRAYNTMPLHAEAAARQPIVRRAITAAHPHIVLLPVAPEARAVHSLEAHQAEAVEVDSPVAEEAEAAEEDKSITKCQNADKNINDL
jgi:hypothetical protein